MMKQPMKSQRRKITKRTARWAALLVGLVIFAIGTVLLPLPIPLGIIFMVIGLFIASFNPLVMRWIQRTRRRSPRVNAHLRAATPHLPGFLRHFVERTDFPSRPSPSRQKPDQAP